MMQKLMEINDHLVRTLAECEQLRSDQKTLQEICSIRLQRIKELQAELRKACAERDEAKENAGRLQAERDELRKEQSKLQSICADGGRRITELKAELDATRKQLQDVLFEQEDISSVEPAGQSDLVRDVSHYTEAAEVDRSTEPQPEQDGVLVQEGWWLQADGNRVYVRPTNPTASNKGKIAQGYVWSDGVRLYHSDGGHGDTPTPHDLVKFLGKHVKTQLAEPQQSQPVVEFKPYTFAAYVVGDKSRPHALRIVWATEDWIEFSKFSIVHRISDLQFSGNDTFTPDQFSVNLKIQ